MPTIREAIDATDDQFFVIAADHLFTCTCASCLRFLVGGLYDVNEQEVEDTGEVVADVEALIDAEDTPENRKRIVDIAGILL